MGFDEGDEAVERLLGLDLDHARLRAGLHVPGVEDALVGYVGELRGEARDKLVETAGVSAFSQRQDLAFHHSSPCVPADLSSFRRRSGARQGRQTVQRGAWPRATQDPGRKPLDEAPRRGYTRRRSRQQRPRRPSAPMSRLILLRHGQSAWNLENRFTGWVDVDLTEEGEAQAKRAGDLMREAGLKPSCAYSSVLTRAVRTLWIALHAMDRVWIPVTKDYRLNERHYGALAGLNKAETAEKHGEAQVKIWRRSYDVPPPAVAADDDRHPRFDPRYADLDPSVLPASESLKTTLERVAPYFNAEIAPRLTAGEDVIVAAHGNSLRALVKQLFEVSDAAIMGYEVPTGNPLAIELDGVRPRAAAYLDADRAKPLPPAP